MTDENRFSSEKSPKQYSMRTFATTSTLGGKLEGKLEVFGETKLGLDYYRRNWNATTAMFMEKISMFKNQSSIPDVDTKNIGAFIQQKKGFTDKLKLTAGLRLDNTHTKAKKDRRSFYGLYFKNANNAKTDTYLSGNVQLDYDIAKRLNVYAGFGHTVRPPDPQERYFALQRMGTRVKPDKAGNPKLKPVKNDEFDIGITYKEGRVLFNSRFFYSDLTDFIVVRDIYCSERYARTYKNKDARIYGNETSARLALPFNVFASARISCARGKNDLDGTDLPEIPPIKGNLKLRYDNGSCFGEIEGLFAAAQDKLDIEIAEEKTSGFAIASLRAGYYYKSLRIFSGINNVFNKKYYEHLSYLRDPFRSGIRVPEPGRTFYVSLRYKF